MTPEQNKNEVPYSIKSNPIPEFDHLKFLSKIRIDQQTQCWEWQGYVDSKGYGVMSIPGHKYLFKVHRVLWKNFFGPIGEGMIIDHICRNRKCINPCHLREASQKENTINSIGNPANINSLKKECIRGHEFTMENTRINSNGSRSCRQCVRKQRKEYKSRKIILKKTTGKSN